MGTVGSTGADSILKTRLIFYANVWNMMRGNASSGLKMVIETSPVKSSSKYLPRYLRSTASTKERWNSLSLPCERQDRKFSLETTVGKMHCHFGNRREWRPVWLDRAESHTCVRTTRCLSSRSSSRSLSYGAGHNCNREASGAGGKARQDHRFSAISRQVIDKAHQISPFAVLETVRTLAGLSETPRSASMHS